MLQILFTENIWILGMHTLCLVLCFFLLCTLQITGFPMVESLTRRLEDRLYRWY